MTKTEAMRAKLETLKAENAAKRTEVLAALGRVDALRLEGDAMRARLATARKANYVTANAIQATATRIQAVDASTARVERGLMGE